MSWKRDTKTGDGDLVTGSGTKVKQLDKEEKLDKGEEERRAAATTAAEAEDSSSSESKKKKSHKDESPGEKTRREQDEAEEAGEVPSGLIVNKKGELVQAHSRQ